MLQKIIVEIQFYRRLLLDPETPKIAKWCLYLGLAYLASPIDLIPDFVPILGYFDDLLIVGGLFALARALTPGAVLNRCRESAQPRETLNTSRSS